MSTIPPTNLELFKKKETIVDQYLFNLFGIRVFLFVLLQFFSVVDCAYSLDTTLLWSPTKV